MSSALAAARKRRINGSQSESNLASTQNPGFGVNNIPQPPNYAQNIQNQNNIPSQNSGLTLPQVISLVDKRLITLEQFMKHQQSAPENSTMNNIPSNMNNIVDEFNTRFSILAEEIDSMKDILIKLQSFTMDVNKNLLDERIRIFSDIGTINTSLDIKRNIQFDNLENIKDFSQKMDYLEQTGEFSMSNEFANYNNECLTDSV